MPRSPEDPADRNECYRDLFGYLNFSDGRPGARFRKCLNHLYAGRPANEIRADLESQLTTLSTSGDSAFQEMKQASSAITSVFDHVIPAYTDHHQDLLFHLTPKDFSHPLFLAHVFEATLTAGGAAGWNAPLGLFLN